jgi:hypothetical protein
LFFVKIVFQRARIAKKTIETHNLKAASEACSGQKMYQKHFSVGNLAI